MPDIDAGAAKDDITDADLALVLTDGATYQDVLVTAQSCARKVRRGCRCPWVASACREMSVTSR
jgi:hypothetical protein